MRHVFLCTALIVGSATIALQDADAQSRSTLELGASTNRSIIVEQFQAGTVAPVAVVPTVAPTVPLAPPAHVPGTPQEASLSMPVQFDLNSDALRPEAMAILNMVAAGMLDPTFRGDRFLIEGHTDATGTWPFNLTLSQRRASSVAQYLIGQGVAGERIEIIGYGWNRPVPGLDPRHPRHRRVEFGRLAK